MAIGGQETRSGAGEILVKPAGLSGGVLRIPNKETELNEARIMVRPVGCSEVANRTGERVTSLIQTGVCSETPERNR